MSRRGVELTATRHCGANACIGSVSSNATSSGFVGSLAIQCPLMRRTNLPQAMPGSIDCCKCQRMMVVSLLRHCHWHRHTMWQVIISVALFILSLRCASETYRNYYACIPYFVAGELESFHVFSVLFELLISNTCMFTSRGSLGNMGLDSATRPIADHPYVHKWSQKHKATQVLQQVLSDLRASTMSASSRQIWGGH